MLRNQIRIVFTLAAAMVVTPLAMGIDATVGTGDDTSIVSIEFSDGNVFDFAVSYTDDGTVTGEDLLNIMVSESTFTYVGEFFDFGPTDLDNLFVYGMSFGGSSEGTFGVFGTSPSVWNRDNGLEPWTFASTGPTDRFVFDGSQDGYSFSNYVIPEPTSIALLGLGGLALVARRKRKAA